MNLLPWAIKWGVPAGALADLHAQLGLDGLGAMPDDMRGSSEAAAQAAVRREAAQKGVRLYRNNVGALPDETGRIVRYGLGNDSSKINKIIKSGDLVGWRRLMVTQAMVGGHVAQFVSREIKEPGWKWTGTERENAQSTWALMLLADGGDAGFATGEGTL